MKAYTQGDSGSTGAQPQDYLYSQYQQYQYYGQYPNQGGAYNYQANPAYQQQYQQYNQYYQQYYGQPQATQNYYQYPYGGVAQGAANSYYQGQNYVNPQNMQPKQNIMPYGATPMQNTVKPAAPTNPQILANQNKQIAADTQGFESQKDELLDEIKKTVLNNNIKNGKSRWSQEVIVPMDIYEHFEKKSDKKKFDFDLLNLLNEQQKKQFNSYVKKCFDKCQNAKEQQLMGSMLLTNLTTLIFKKSLDTVKWENQFMPLLPREKDKPASSGPQFAFSTSHQASTSSSTSNNLSIPGLPMPGSGSFTGGGQTQQQYQQQSQFLNKDSFQQQSELKNTSITSTLPFSINSQPTSSINQLYNNNNNHLNQHNQHNQQHNHYNNNNNNNNNAQQGKNNKQMNFNNNDDNYNNKNNGKRHANIDIKEIVKTPQPKKQLKIEKQQKQAMTPPMQISLSNADTDQDFEQLVTKWNIVGTCTDIEKPYLRLTKEPSPDQVRPEEVLKKSLKFLMTKWRDRDCEYSYIQSQFRSIRQDLIIQHIRNEFTAKVCEYNARICLEVDDVGQYVQCCATLFDLYNSGIQGEKEEFYCYKIIDQGLDNKSPLELPKLINEVQAFIDHPLIQFAIDLLRAHDNGNVYQFFKLYEKAPNMCQCIIERNMSKYKLWSLVILSKTYFGKISLEDLVNMVKFDDTDHAKEFIQSTGGVLDESGKELLLKDSHKGFVDTFQQM
ncbi:hypothetical protein ABPG72_012590 [Tetrahymena utriculariae]